MFIPSIYSLKDLNSLQKSDHSTTSSKWDNEKKKKKKKNLQKWVKDRRESTHKI